VVSNQQLYLAIGIAVTFNAALIGLLFACMKAGFDAVDRRFDAIDHWFDDLRDWSKK